MGEAPQGVRSPHVEDMCLFMEKISGGLQLSVEKLPIIHLARLCSDELQFIPGLRLPGFRRKWAVGFQMHPMSGLWKNLSVFMLYPTVGFTSFPPTVSPQE